MRIVAGVVAIGAVMQVGNASAEPGAANGRVSPIQIGISQSDLRGDFESAVPVAGACLTVSGGTTGTPNNWLVNPSCALGEVDGNSRDQARALEIEKVFAGHDADDDAALDLAEDYLDGVDVRRDPVEAAVLVWRVEHGA